jgi:hypothetical protein
VRDSELPRNAIFLHDVHGAPVGELGHHNLRELPERRLVVE